MIIHMDDDKNYISKDQNSYTFWIEGWFAGKIAHCKANKNGKAQGIGPDTWAIRQYNRIRKNEMNF